MIVNWFYDTLPEELKVAILQDATQLHENEVRQFCSPYTVRELVKFMWYFQSNKNKNIVIYVNGKPSRRSISASLTRECVIQNMIIYKIPQWVKSDEYPYMLDLKKKTQKARTVTSPQKDTKDTKGTKYTKYTNAYILFCESERHRVLQENPELLHDFGGMNKRLSSLWGQFKLNNPSEVLRLKQQADLINVKNGLF